MHYFISLSPFILPPPPPPPPFLHIFVVFLNSFLLLHAEQVSSAKCVCLVFTKSLVLMLTGDWLFLLKVYCAALSPMHVNVMVIYWNWFHCCCFHSFHFKICLCIWYNMIKLRVLRLSLFLCPVMSFSMYLYLQCVFFTFLRSSSYLQPYFSIAPNSAILSISIFKPLQQSYSSDQPSENGVTIRLTPVPHNWSLKNTLLHSVAMKASNFIHAISVAHFMILHFSCFDLCLQEVCEYCAYPFINLYSFHCLQATFIRSNIWH
jgi:hypothetical protein